MGVILKGFGDYLINLLATAISSLFIGLVLGIPMKFFAFLANIDMSYLNISFLLVFGIFLLDVVVRYVFGSYIDALNRNISLGNTLINEQKDTVEKISDLLLSIKNRNGEDDK